MGLDIFKSPRGFLKVIQIIFVICAFSIVCAYHETVVLRLNCGSANKSSALQTAENDELQQNQLNLPIVGPENDTHEFYIELDYPFKIEKSEINGTDCQGDETKLNVVDQSSSDAVFFVFTGVTSLLYSTIALLFYVFCDSTYKGRSLIPSIDLISHMVLVIFWFAGSIALAVGIQQFEDNLSTNALSKENKLLCFPNKCSVVEEIDVGALVAADVFGYLSIIVYGVNLWFVYKETAHFQGASIAK